jgi:hypothetical protein
LEDEGDLSHAEVDSYATCHLTESEKLRLYEHCRHPCDCERERERDSQEEQARAERLSLSELAMPKRAGWSGSGTGTIITQDMAFPMSAKATAAAYGDLTFRDWCRTQPSESAEPWGADVNVDVDDPAINMETHPLAFTQAHAQVLRKRTPGVQHASGESRVYEYFHSLPVVTRTRPTPKRPRSPPLWQKRLLQAIRDAPILLCWIVPVGWTPAGLVPGPLPKLGTGERERRSLRDSESIGLRELRADRAREAAQEAAEEAAEQRRRPTAQPGPDHDCVMAVAFRRVPCDVVTLDRDDARRGRAGAAGATVLQVLVRASANGNEWDQHELPREEGCTAQAVRVQQYRARLP